MGRRRALSEDLIDRDPARIEGMFGHIVPRYDILNRLMTLGLDRRWRRIAATQASLARGGTVLDTCCGTGDLTFTLTDMYPGCAVVGLDFSGAMLARAEEKSAARSRRGRTAAPRFVRGDLLDLPFSDGEFSAVTVGWGVRNVPDVRRAFGEMARVTRPGGRVVCLESTPVRVGLAGRFHRVWMGHVVPALGRLIAGEAEAYAYLPASVESFPGVEELAAIMGHAGLTGIRFRRFGFDGVAIHVGEVPGAADTHQP